MAGKIHANAPKMQILWANLSRDHVQDARRLPLLRLGNEEAAAADNWVLHNELNCRACIAFKNGRLTR
jgi:hypothetical protein